MHIFLIEEILLYLPFEKMIKIHKWSYFKEIPDNIVNIWDWAAINGRLDIIKWLHKTRVEGCSKFTMDN
ncbi:MAG: hypothetical protein ACRCZI_05825, partial [Cetobacterium sp.]